MKRTKVLYLDIDGTVRKGFDELGRYVNGPEDVQIFPSVKALLHQYKDAGWRIVGISNQGGIALGLVSYMSVATSMLETDRQCDSLFDRIAFCMHHPDAKNPDYKYCWCRKPSIGLIVDACISMGQQHSEYYPPHAALFVGDRPEDEQCANNAHITFMSAVDWRAQSIHCK